MKCIDCGKVFNENDVLIENNPFKPDFTIYGCPNCKEIEQFVGVCDVIGCENQSSGTQTHGRFFMSLCYDHNDKLMDKRWTDKKV